MDDHLTVHGIDGVLDPTSASKCFLPNPTVEIKSQVDRSFLDHAIRALNRRGFTIVATAMAIKRLDLLRLKAVTVFAPADETLFSSSDGFRYDFLHHVVPKRLRLMELSRVPAGTLMETMAPNKMVVTGETDGSLTINGVKINLTEVYYNPWIVVVSVARSLDDTTADVSGKLLDSGNDRVPSPSPDYSTVINQFSGELSDSSKDRIPASAPNFEVNSQSPTGFSVSGFTGVPSAAQDYSNGISEFSGDTSDSVNTGTPSPSPAYNGDSDVRNEFNHFRVPSPAPMFSREAVNSMENLSPATKQEFVTDYNDGISSQSPSPIHSGEAKTVVGSSAPASEQVYVPSNAPPSPSPSPAGSTLTDRRCSPAIFNGVDSAVLLGIEGGDLFCPVTVRKLEELNTGDVDQFLPSDALSQLSEGEVDQSLPLITLGKDEEEDDSGSRRRDQMFMADDLFFYN